jgi:hypothetical protein
MHIETSVAQTPLDQVDVIRVVLNEEYGDTSSFSYKLHLSSIIGSTRWKRPGP